METIIFGQWWRSHQSLACKGLCIFRFCVMSWKGEWEPSIKYCLGRKMSWFKDSTQYRTLDTIDGELMEFEWNIFTGFTTLQLVDKVQEFKNKMGDPTQFKERIIFMSMFNDIIWGSEDNERECRANATLVSAFAKRSPARRWSFLGPGSETEWYSTYNERPQREWDRVAELRMIKFGESGHPVFRATSPVSRGTLKSKGGGKLSIHFCADGETIETVFRTIISVNQLSFYGAVSDLCEEYSACQTRTGRPVLERTVWPIVRASKIIDNDTFDWDSCTKNIAKIERTSRKALTTRSSNKDLYWCKFPESSWSRTVLHDKGHWRVLTICRTSDMSWVHFATRWKFNWPERLDRGNTKIGPVLEVTTSYLQGKHGVEITNESVNKDNSHSWVRISHGLNKLVTDLIDKEYDDNEQETSETKTEACALKKGCTCFCKPTKGQSKTTKTYLCLLIYKNCTYSWKNMDWCWTRSSIQSGAPGGKKNKHSSSTRTIISRRRWSDWILEIKRLSSERIWELSILVWWNVEEQNGRRRRQQEKISIMYWLVRTRNSLSPSSLRSFSTQSHWSYTSGQCVNSGQFLRVHLSYWMCNQFTLHHKFRIDSGRTKFRKGKPDSILYGCESQGQGSQRSVWVSLDQTTSCIVREKVEKAPGYGVLGRYTACSTKRIELLSNKM